ncbi:MAG: hypothetical protein C0603_00255 [Denitrovibrio sp.]|nr:MAG: hypothetical protein C0603_00255 [Denitrovibrio sp.]
MDSHILHNYVLKNDNSWTNLKDDINNVPDNRKLHWIHLYRESIDTQKFLYESGVDEVIIDRLTDPETRPRVTVFPDGILINIRAVNTCIDSESHEMLSMRMFVQENKIISTSLKHLHVLDEITEIINSNYAPNSISDFVSYIIELITDRIEAYISEERDKVYELEAGDIKEDQPHKQAIISDIRRSLIGFERYLSPQNDVLAKLLNPKISLFNNDDKIAVNECLNNTRRYLEEISSVNTRCHILKDDMHSISNDKINRNMYMLSIVAAVFLPLSFLTGLFCSNVGGIPWAEHPKGFTYFSIILGVFLIAQIFLLRLSKRF